MKWVTAFLLLLGLSCVFAQDRTSATYVYDIDGRRVPWATSTAGTGGTRQTTRSVNGREVPQEKVEEKVVQEPDGARTVERLIRRFDANGEPLPPEKSVSREVKNPDGSTTVVTSTYRGDLNGHLKLSERSSVQTTTSGGATRSEMIVERPDFSGNLAPFEKRVARVSGTAGQSETEETIFRKDSNSRFSEAARTVLRQSKVSGAVVEQSDEYENASTGAMKLTRQSISRVVKNPDGSESRVVDVFGVAAPGRPASGQGLQLRERQFIEKRSTPDGGVVESFSIQRPSLSSTRELGPVHKISETVCTGKCAAPAPAKP
jgi:hypothetical protein